MREDEQKSDRQDKWKFSYFPVWRYGFFFCMLIILIIFIGGVLQTAQYTEKSVRLSARDAQARISYRVEQSLKTMQMLASRREYYDPALPIEDKIGTLEAANSQMGYMMMKYVDADINVRSFTGHTSLASRDYMQRLFSTSQPQVTDSFPAGADGKTLNYTIAVPLMYEGKVSGAIFCAIYFDEIQKILTQASAIDGIEAVLTGGKQQVMSTSQIVNFGEPYVDSIRDGMFFGSTPDRFEADLLNGKSGAYWSFQNGQLCYTMYIPVENTKWSLISRGNFMKLYAVALPSVLLLIFLSVMACGGLLWLVDRHVKKQMRVTDLLVQSLQELERKIYQDDRPEDVDFQDIIQLTSTGLSDGLTGVVTRTVFLNQLQSQLDKYRSETLTALCFVDLDDLKSLNDTYGHKIGDVALKSIGYVLREYEKKYDGLVGRYGGDEFVLLLTDLDNEDELKEVLDELTIRLHCNIGKADEPVDMHCSVGVSIRKEGETVERWIEKADEALYFVKQNGKGYYKIYQD